MPEVILVILQRPETAPLLLAAGERMAVLAGGAHLAVLAASATEYAALRAAYETWLARPASAGTLWHAASAEPARVIAERGARADLIVAARPQPDDPPRVQAAFRAALLESARPVLVVPPRLAGADFGRRVAIAWREDAHTAKVVLPALRYAAAAEAVFVLAGMRPGRAVPVLPPLLTERHVAAELRLLPIGPVGFGENLLSELHALEVDLLVMGAFAHTRLHDFLYGGVTRFMLARADLPVLMRF